MTKTDEQKREQERQEEYDIKHPDHRTLAEINAEDKRQTCEIVMKNFNRRTFRSEKEAGMYHIYAILEALRSLGVASPESIPDDETARKVFDTHEIKFEKRLDREDSWRNGIYIYKRNDLVYFISRVLNYIPSIISIPGQAKDTLARFSVITNVGAKC